MLFEYRPYHGPYLAEKKIYITSDYKYCNNIVENPSNRAKIFFEPTLPRIVMFMKHTQY